MEEVLNFIKDNLKTVMNKKSARLDYTTENKLQVKIYKCGSRVTRIDIVNKEEE